MKKMTAIVLLLGLFTGCQTQSESTTESTQTNESQAQCICIEIYAPVCGSDGKTYANSCHAGCAGVESFTDGECE